MIQLSLFQAIVTEMTEGAKSAEASVTVNILDRNDNSPVFPPSGYTVQLAEGEGRRDVTTVSCSQGVILANGSVYIHI